MKIKERFCCRDVNCYVVEEDTSQYELTYRGLYDEYIMKALIAEGYKFLDYHGRIIAPDGISIEEIVESPCTLDLSQIDGLFNLEETALPEEEAAKYFDRNFEVKTVEMRKPDVQINTRKELIEYLDTFARLDRAGLANDDVYPLNSFVNPEALFTLEEIQTDFEAARYMGLIDRRRKIKTYAAFKKLISFLQSQGLLQERYTASDVKTAYLSWGFCGINAKVTDMREQLGVETNIFREGSSTSCTNIEYGLMDRQGEVHTSMGIINPAEEDGDISEYSSIQLSYPKRYWNAYHAREGWSTKLVPIECTVPVRNNRTVMTMIGSTGVTYKVLIDPDTYVINTNATRVIFGQYLTCIAYNGQTIGIDKCLTEHNYKIWCMCNAKAHDLIDSRIKVSPVQNSYDLVTGEGVNPYGAIRYIARRIKQDPTSDANTRYRPSGDWDYLTAAEKYAMFTTDESDEVFNRYREYIAKYNPEGRSYDTFDELIDIMVSTKEMLEDNGQYLNIKGLTSGTSEYESVHMEMTDRPIENLVFARDVLQGEVSIDNLGNGQIADGESQYNRSTALLMQLAAHELGTDYDIVSLQNFLQNLDSNRDIIDLDKVFVERTGAFNGALRDRANLNCYRAQEARFVTYITRVYREAANLPADQQRHYMFDCIAIDFGKREISKMAAAQYSIADSIKAALDADTTIPYRQKELLSIESYSTALSIMFRAALQDITLTISGKNVTIELPVFEGHKINIEISVDVYNRVSNLDNYLLFYNFDLYRWCKMEVRDDGRFSFYCLNANITPWRITPKPGVSLKSYNFALNYISDDTYQKYTKPEFRAKCEAMGAKVAELCYEYKNNLSEGQSIDLGFVYDIDTIDIVTSCKVTERLIDYYQRFKLKQKDALKKGLCLQRMRLKSDIHLSNFIDESNPDYMSPEADVYVSAVDCPDTTEWKHSIEVLTVEGSTITRGIETDANIVTPFSFDDCSFNDIVRWQGIINGDYSPKAVIVVYGTQALITTEKGQLAKDLSDISLEDCQKLVDKGIFYQLGAREFLIKAGHSYFKLEVR